MPHITPRRVGAYRHDPNRGAILIGYGVYRPSPVAGASAIELDSGEVLPGHSCAWLSEPFVRMALKPSRGLIACDNSFDKRHPI